MQQAQVKTKWLQQIIQKFKSTLDQTLHKISRTQGQCKHCMLQQHKCYEIGINGTASSGKRTRYFDIKCFYFIGLIKREEMQAEYCPTNEVTSDDVTTCLVRSNLIKFKNCIINVE
jgi:hypothetical protein